MPWDADTDNPTIDEENMMAQPVPHGADPAPLTPRGERRRARHIVNDILSAARYQAMLGTVADLYTKDGVARSLKASDAVVRVVERSRVEQWEYLTALGWLVRTLAARVGNGDPADTFEDPDEARQILRQFRMSIGWGRTQNPPTIDALVANLQVTMLQIADPRNDDWMAARKAHRWLEQQENSYIRTLQIIDVGAQLVWAIASLHERPMGLLDQLTMELLMAETRDAERNAKGDNNG